MSEALQKALSEASISRGKCTLSESNTSKFRDLVNGISFDHLEAVEADFKKGNEVRDCLIDFIKDRTQTLDLRGEITKIGSSWDGTKVGHLDEVDTLYVLNRDQVTIVHDNSDGDEHFLYVKWNGNTYTAGKFSELFADKLNKALSTEPPESMEHNGYASPRYSGIRMSGPAVTVLFRTATDIGPILKGSMVSLDITLALPWSCLASNQKERINGMRKWFKDHISSTNNRPIEAGKPHFIACLVNKEKVWKATSAHMEANALHGLEPQCALTKAHRRLKCLLKKMDTFNSEHNLLESDFDENEARSTLIRMITDLVDIENVNRCMRHGYIFLSPSERKELGELEKKNISFNATAAKQILFQKATQDDYKPGSVDNLRAQALMKKVLVELANEGSLYIKNQIHDSFPLICKFSVLDTLSGKFDELASNLLFQCNILASASYSDVSIGMFG